MATEQQIIEEILETVRFIKDNASTQDGLDAVRRELRADVADVRDYLDKKISELRGDIHVLLRKEDDKLKAAFYMLHNRQMFSDEELKRLLTMEPFPQLVK